MKLKRFLAVYEIDDGYVGGARPHHFGIREDDIEKDMTENDLKEFFNQAMQSDFEQNIYPFPKNEDEFIVWAKEIQSQIED